MPSTSRPNASGGLFGASIFVHHLGEDDCHHNGGAGLNDSVQHVGKGLRSAQLLDQIVLAMADQAAMHTRQ